MKKRLLGTLVCLCVLAFSACGKGQTPPPLPPYNSTSTSSSTSSSSSSKKPVTPIQPGGNFDGGEEYGK